MFVCSLLNAGMAVIFPSEIALVCRGDQLELICSTSGELLEWSFYLTEENETNAPKYVRVFELNTNITITFSVNSTEFTLSTKSSGTETLPLMSTLLIKTISSNLNGTEVTCTDLYARESTATSIKVMSIPNLMDDPLEVNISSLSETFSSTNVTAVLHWTQSSTINSYHNFEVTVVPQAKRKQLGNTTFELILDYNTPFNVSIVSMHPCRQNNVIISTELYYSEFISTINLKLVILFHSVQKQLTVETLPLILMMIQ